MIIRYTVVSPVDCTSDPHPVAYTGRVKEKRIVQMMKDILDVCVSDLVSHVRVTHADIGGVRYASDSYGLGALSTKDNNQKPANSDEAVRNKVAGLTFWHDGKYDGEESGVKTREVPPGLSGLKEIIKIINKDPTKLEGLTVGVIWKFAGDHSCSDYINVGTHDDDCRDQSGLHQVNYRSQDYWISLPGYLPWCDAMEELLGKSFPRRNPDSVE